MRASRPYDITSLTTDVTSPYRSRTTVRAALNLSAWSFSTSTNGESPTWSSESTIVAPLPCSTCPSCVRISSSFVPPCMTFCPQYSTTPPPPRNSSVMATVAYFGACCCSRLYPWMLGVGQHGPR